MSEPADVRCPVCRRVIPPVERDGPFRPFCSRRCKTVDLGAWLTEAYRVSRPLDEEELDTGVPGCPGADDDAHPADGSTGTPRGGGRGRPN